VWNVGNKPRCCRFGRLSHLLSASSACQKTLGRPTWESKLLLQRAQNQTKGLSPDQVDEVSESAQAPDVPLVFTEAVVVDFSVDQDALLLVERQAFQLLACDWKSVLIVGVVLWWGCRGRALIAGGVGGRLLERQETHGAGWVVV
jgi:hypothetical protein